MWVILLRLTINLPFHNTSTHQLRLFATHHYLSQTMTLVGRLDWSYGIPSLPNPNPHWGQKNRKKKLNKRKNGISKSIPCRDIFKSTWIPF